MNEPSAGTAFGRLLRRRRRQRNVTQEELAYRADLSSRHVSFLETGRSDPSRDSLLAIARALDLPLRDRNALLRVAGFAPAHPERDLLVAEGSHIRSLFGFLLERHEPYPAFVLDRTWTVRMHNRAATHLLSWLLDAPASARRTKPGGGDTEPEGSGPAGRPLAGVNLLRVLFDPDGLRPLAVNFEQVGRYLRDRLDERIALWPDDDGLVTLREQLDGLGPLPDGGPDPIPDPPAEGDFPALPIHLRKDGTDLRMLSFLMSVAAPREAGMHGARMETFLPADGESDEVIRDLGET